MTQIFDIDAKAFFAFQVRAATETDAKRVAAAFLESLMTATPETCEGYNSTTPGRPIVPAEIAPALDGIDVEPE